MTLDYSAKKTTKHHDNMRSFEWAVWKLKNSPYFSAATLEVIQPLRTNKLHFSAYQPVVITTARLAVCPTNPVHPQLRRSLVPRHAPTPATPHL
jgi:hypothetical protein